MLEPENFKPKLFKKLLEKAKGDNSITKFSDISGVDRTYLSKYLNLKKEKAPTPKIIRKISDNSSVKYEDLMVAAGYLDEKFMEIDEIMMDYYDYHEPDKAKAIKKIKSDGNKEEIVFIYNIDDSLIWEKTNEFDYIKDNYDYFATKISLRVDYGIKLKENQFKELGFFKGDILLVEKKKNVVSGSTILVIIKKEEKVIEKTIKRYYELSDGNVRLEPDKNMNSTYDKSQIEIIGEVITMRRDLEV
jgi:transcriptional regulator with XRE-family HTH domain